MISPASAQLDHLGNPVRLAERPGCVAIDADRGEQPSGYNSHHNQQWFNVHYRPHAERNGLVVGGQWDNLSPERFLPPSLAVSLGASRPAAGATSGAEYARRVSAPAFRARGCASSSVVCVERSSWVRQYRSAWQAPRNCTAASVSSHQALTSVSASSILAVTRSSRGRSKPQNTSQQSATSARVTRRGCCQVNSSRPALSPLRSFRRFSNEIDLRWLARPLSARGHFRDPLAGAWVKKVASINSPNPVRAENPWAIPPVVIHIPERGFSGKDRTGH